MPHHVLSPNLIQQQSSEILYPRIKKTTKFRFPLTQMVMKVKQNDTCAEWRNCSQVFQGESLEHISLYEQCDKPEYN